MTDDEKAEKIWIKLIHAAYYAGGKRIMRNGVPTKVAAWYDELSDNGKKMIGQNNIMAPYNRKYMRLTE